VQPRAFRCQMRDLGDGYVVGRYIINGETLFGTLLRQQDRFHNIADVDIRFALSSIPENSQLAWIFHQLPQKIKTDAVRLPRADHIPESEHPAGEIEHMTIRTN